MYFDPGTGSLIIQILIAGLASIGAFFALFKTKIGNIFHPDTISRQFKEILKAAGLREIRFHDLRHSCASLLLSRGAAMKEIQEWMGHSNISTTADIYSHLDYSAKMASAVSLWKDGRCKSSIPMAFKGRWQISIFWSLLISIMR